MKFIVSQKMVGIVIDFFGRNVRFYDSKDGNVECTVTVNKESMSRWAVQMAGAVKVVSPPELVEDIRGTIRKMAEVYEA